MERMVYPNLATLFEAVAREQGDGGRAADQPALAGLAVDEAEADVLADVNYALSMEAMTAISHFIEDRLIEDGSAGRLFAGFQKLGHVRPQRERYERLKERVAEVFIFGAPDRPCAVEGGSLQAIASTAPDVRDHWWVVSDSETFPICLLAREEATEGGRRIFRGFWSSNPDLVAHVVAVMENLLDSAALAA